MTAAPAPGFVSGRVRWQGLVDAFMVLGLAAPWLGLLGKWHWLLDLCTHFRWQALVVCAVALGWAVAKRRRVVLGVALLSLALNGWLFFKIAAAPSSGNVRPDFMVRIVSLNVLTSNPDHAAVLTFLQQADADILFLMEVDQRWAQALQPLLLTHPHHLIKPLQDNFGLALFSRLPLEELRLLSAEELAPGDANELIQDSIQIRLKTANREWGFLGVHPLPPMGRDYSAARDLQLQALGRHIAASPHPMLIAGDLNATPWSHGYHLLISGTKLASDASARKPTWRVGTLFAIPIDHTLCTPPLRVQSRSIGPDVGSDHRAQTTEVRWAD
jgi:endonuclease/exonuclease/phosphatase (EEP) superfamily protein YafD